MDASDNKKGVGLLRQWKDYIGRQGPEEETRSRQWNDNAGRYGPQNVS